MESTNLTLLHGHTPQPKMILALWAYHSLSLSSVLLNQPTPCTWFARRCGIPTQPAPDRVPRSQRKRSPHHVSHHWKLGLHLQKRDIQNITSACFTSNGKQPPTGWIIWGLNQCCTPNSNGFLSKKSSHPKIWPFGWYTKIYSDKPIFSPPFLLGGSSMWIPRIVFIA